MGNADNRSNLVENGPQGDAKMDMEWQLGMDLQYPSSKSAKGSSPTSASELDPWAIAVPQTFGVPWNDLSQNEKVKRVCIGIAKGIALTCLLYFFVCSLDCLSLGFRIVGGRTTGNIFRQSDILKNPVVGVMVGILTTVLVQSSSTSTSIIVSMVAAEFLTVKTAIPIIMGANIGTSITNTIVSLTQAGDRNQFRRAFAGATVHDMFNWLTVITLLIIEVLTGYLFHVSSWIMDRLISDDSASGSEIEILGKITKPFVNLIVQIDKKVLECWSNENCTTHDNSSLLKDLCTVEGSDPKVEEDCKYIFHGTSMSDPLVGAIVLVASLICLCLCLLLIVKVLNSVLQGQIAMIIKKTLNAKVPYIPWITGYIAILVGAVMTFLVQSSSVFTSALTPLVGLGVLTVERVYPLTLGSNIGTTTTAMLASLATEGSSLKPSVQIAVCHLLFNVTGILIFYPIPLLRWPIPMAKFLGDTTAKYRWFAIVYMILMFVVLPGIFMALSFAGTAYVIVAAAIIVFLFAFISLVNLMRKVKPSFLPAFLLSWKWLPVYFRSLQPYDNLFLRFRCCRTLKEKNQDHLIEHNTELTFSTEDQIPHYNHPVGIEVPNGTNTPGGKVNTAYVQE